MNIKYKDVLLKLDYYRGLVVKELAARGVMLADKEIQSRMDKIDSYIAIFNHQNVKSEESFDTAAFEKGLEDIYLDLKILYDILYQETVSEYEKISSYVDVHLRSLETTADSYKARADIEINSTALGETIYFKSNGFPMFNKDNYTYVELANLLIREGSTIAFLVDGYNVSLENIALGLKRGDDVHYISPHNYLQDRFRVQGSPAVTEYEVSMDEDLVLNTPFELQHEELKPNPKNAYNILGGKDLVTITQKDTRDLVKRNDELSFFVEGHWSASFYIEGGTYAQFQFSSEEVNKNFEGYEVSELNSVHLFEMNSEKDFAFSVFTDGVIYAEKERGLVKEERLIYPKGSRAKNFLIKEAEPGREIAFEAFLRIKSDTSEYPVLNSVAIKELRETEVLYNDTV